MTTKESKSTQPEQKQFFDLHGTPITEMQYIANSRGWTFKELCVRWGKSPRTLSRIAANPEQRDLDAVNGLPKKKNVIKSGRPT